MLKIQGRVTHREINSIIFSNRHGVEYGHFDVTEGLLYSARDCSFSYQLEKLFLWLILPHAIKKPVCLRSLKRKQISHNTCLCYGFGITGFDCKFFVCEMPSLLV